MTRVLGGVERPAAELRVLALLLERLEAEPFEDARLAALQAALRGEGAPASARIAALVRVVSRMEWARNQFFAPFAFVLAWAPLHASAMERWRASAGRASRALARGRRGARGALLARGLRLRAPRGRVARRSRRAAWTRPAASTATRSATRSSRSAVRERRAARRRAPRACSLVSGSNMSGKSTYLRTVGVNVVLALAGAPVRAARLRLSPLAARRDAPDPGLAAGRPLALLRRDHAAQASSSTSPRGPLPLLFLLDEILHGTNSHDRRIGAEAIVRGLLARGAIGLVTTHDLALTELAGADWRAARTCTSRTR